ncbi:hypothetical protein [Phenylobacterium sp.]|uniref:hypothetical protein n=1 Tax=Phenylobacterium sp. TaxID=1871053 RepID=UPI002E353D89|nr:hypothetical protein [Phenylobacterium sp.]HEX3366412.1 hypothetical protein [Phenylobacterium sp.]
MGGSLLRGGLVMAYFCYIHRRTGGVPHFEVLPDSTEGHAVDIAARLLAQRADAVRAEVWEDERLVFTLPRDVIAPPPANPSAT